MKTSGRFIVAVLLLSIAAAAHSTTFIMPSDREMISKSDAIVIGAIEGSYVQLGATSVDTIYELRVDRVLKGVPQASQLIRVASPGGEIGGRTMLVHGAAHFDRGEKVLLFLTLDDRRWQPTDMLLGKFRFARSVVGDSLLVRDLDDFDEEHAIGKSKTAPVRSEKGFIRFIEETVAGKAGSENYLETDDSEFLAPLEAKVVENSALYTPQSYTLMSTLPLGVRWIAADMTAGVPFRKRVDQNLTEAGDGGVSVIQSGLSSWNSECGSVINIPYNGTTMAIAGGTAVGCGDPSICDFINVIEFNDPQNKITGSFTGSGTVGVTFVVFNSADHGDGFREMFDADVVFQDGVTASTSGLGTAMTHEIGHGIGWRHSNADPAIPNGNTVSCNVAEEDCTPTNTAIMFFIATGGFNFTLQPWDQNAARAVYPGGSCSRPFNDFNADGRSDILWRDANGRNAMWLTNPASPTGHTFFGLIEGVVDPVNNWRVVGTGDFDGDGRPDIFWRDAGGRNAMWITNPAAPTGHSFFGLVESVIDPASNWQVVGVGDFNADGRDDLLWRDDNGRNAMWLTDPANARGHSFFGLIEGVVDPVNNWKVVGVDDFNGDGRADILWRDNQGRNAMWLTSVADARGHSFFGLIEAVIDPVNNWKVVGVGDFNGDSRADIFWRDNQGRNAMWLTDPANALGHTYFGLVEGVIDLVNNWRVVEVGDFNADGRDDLLWRDNGGRNAMWLTSLADARGHSSFGLIEGVVDPASDWRVVPCTNVTNCP